MHAEMRTVAGMMIECFRGGEGKPLLLLHDELGLDPDDGYLRRLIKTRSVIAPSLPGFGGSALPLWLDSVGDIAFVVLELLDQLGVGSIDVIGCALGGWLAVEMGVMAPARFPRMVLGSPYGVKLGGADRLEFPDIFALSQAELAGRLYHDPAAAAVDPAGLTDAALTAAVRNRESFTLLVWEPYLHNPKLRHRLQRLTSATLFLRGASDGVVSADYVAGFARLLQSAAERSIGNAGHFAHREQPELFVAEALAFLER